MNWVHDPKFDRFICAGCSDANFQELGPVRIYTSWETKFGRYGVLLTPCYPASWYAGFFERGFSGELLTSDNDTFRWHRSLDKALLAAWEEKSRFKEKAHVPGL